jgi:hypothetical protein
MPYAQCRKNKNHNREVLAVGKVLEPSAQAFRGFSKLCQHALVCCRVQFGALWRFPLIRERKKTPKDKQIHAFQSSRFTETVCLVEVRGGQIRDKNNTANQRVTSLTERIRFLRIICLAFQTLISYVKRFLRGD